VSSNHADGTWGAGEHILIDVKFSARVMLLGGSTAAMRLEVGETLREGDSGAGKVRRKIGTAPYLHGNNTDRLRFRSFLVSRGQRP
jgi:hypothetical protein